MNSIAWLHLSDWHQKGPNFDRGVVRDAIINDIRHRERIAPALARIDFVVFSGDLAFSGQPAEYEAARLHLLNPVMGALGVDQGRLFLVPGNHDLSRETIYEMLPTELQKPLDSDSLVQKWLSDQKRARTLEPFEAYREFVSGYTHQPTPDYASIVCVDAGGRRVALLGLNSAWMTARNKDAQGRINDYGYTLIGEPQVYDALAKIADADLRIAVVHHPFDWLNEFDRNRTETRLGRECHFILSGHAHKPQVHEMYGTGGDCVIIPAGASYEKRVAENPRYTIAYNFVHIDFEAGRGTVYLRRWSEQRGECIEDTDSHPGGKFVLNRLPKELGVKKAVPDAPQAALLSVPPSPSFERERTVLEGYLSALISNNTDLEPGGIKQTKIRVVLPLDSIYVGLQADRDRPDVDRRVMQEELDEIKKNLEREENPREREKQYQIWAHHSRVIQRALEISGPREDLSTIVQRHRQVVILGDPGSGKTTLMRYLTLRLARAVLAEPERLFQPQELWDEKKVWQLTDLGPVRLPILLRISHYAEARQRDPDLALVDYLPRYFAGLSVPHAEELGPLLQRLLDEGRCMVLLDGLDEIIDPTDRRKIADAIGQFASVYRETGVPDWLAQSLDYLPARAEERLEAQTTALEKDEEINIQWNKDIPEDVRLEWGRQIKQRRKKGQRQRRSRVIRLAWELLDEARYAHIGNRFAVTSRIAGYHFAGVPGEFEHYTIRRMSMDDIKQFLEKWCPAVERRMAEAPDPTQVEQRSRREIDGIIKAVETTPGVRRMAENPLLLRILAIIHRNEAHLPQRRVELYETASITLLRDWHLERGTPKGAVIDDIKATSLLGPLALYIHENRASGFLSKGETERILGSILARERGEKDPDQPSLETREAVQHFLETVREHSGLFVERGEGLYGFMHLTFEEYFTARQLVSSATRARAQILKRLHQPRWREPILLAVGSLSKQFYDDTHDLLRAILEADSPYEETLYRNLLFAAACVGDSVNVAPVLRQEIARKLLTLYCDRRGAGRFRILQHQVKEALLTLCNDQGDAAVEDALAETLTCCTDSATLDYALDAVEWLKARTQAVADALAAHPDSGALLRAQELLRSVQARRPANGSASLTPTGWDAVRDDAALARLLGAMLHSGWHNLFQTTLGIKEDVIASALHELSFLSFSQVTEAGDALIQQFKRVPAGRRDAKFWNDAAEMLATILHRSSGNKEIATTANRLAQSIIVSLEKQEGAEEVLQAFSRVFFRQIVFSIHGEAYANLLPLETELAQFDITIREAESSVKDTDLTQVLYSAGSHLLKGASASDTLAATFASIAGRFSSSQPLSGQTALPLNEKSLQLEIGRTMLNLLHSSAGAQQYHEAALLLVALQMERFNVAVSPWLEVPPFSTEATAIILADLEGDDATRRLWALQALASPAIFERVQLTEAHHRLLLGLLDSSTEQAALTLKILFSTGITPDLLSWCWSALRRSGQPLAHTIALHLDSVKTVKGDRRILALLNEGLHDESLRTNALELLRKLTWAGTDTFIQAVTWLNGEDTEVRQLAAILLVDQIDLLEVPRSILSEEATKHSPTGGASSWSALNNVEGAVRLLGGLWLHGWDDALTQLWVAQPAKKYLDKQPGKRWDMFRTYPGNERGIRWLLSEAKFGELLVDTFRDALLRLSELEGDAPEGAPQAAHIAVIQQEILRQTEALLTRPDISPLLKAVISDFVSAAGGPPWLPALRASGTEHPLADWLRRALAERGLAPDSPIPDLAGLLTNDEADARAAASLALLAADLPASLIAPLVETAHSLDDRIRMRGMRSLMGVGRSIPCDGSTGAVEILLRLYQDSSERGDRVENILLYNAIIGVEHTRPFWIARWLGAKDVDGTEHQLPLQGLRHISQVSDEVLSLICSVVNDPAYPLATRVAISLAVSNISRLVEARRSYASIHAAFISALDDSQTELRRYASYGLRWTRGQGAWSAVTSLLSVVRDDSDPRTRFYAMGSLGRVLNTVRAFRDVDLSKEALFRWFETSMKPPNRFGVETAKAVKQLPNLPAVEEVIDVETLLAGLSRPENFGFNTDVAAKLKDSERWQELLKDARQEWDSRRYWVKVMPLLPDIIAQMEELLSAPETDTRRITACALARLYHGEDDRLTRLRELLPDDQTLLCTALDAATDDDPWFDETAHPFRQLASHHPWAVKQIAGWVEAKSPEERTGLVDWMLDDLEEVMQGKRDKVEDAPVGFSGWPRQRILLGVLAELSERLTYRVFTRTRDLSNVVSLFARAATDSDNHDVRRFAIRALGNMQQLTDQVADVFFSASQDLESVYRETRTAVTKFKVFGNGSLERLTTSIRSSSITVAYHAALLLGELGISRSEDLGNEGRKRVADELVQLLDDPLANRVIYDFSKNFRGTRVGPLYDVIYEALLRVVAGPDAPGSTAVEGQIYERTPKELE